MPFWVPPARRAAVATGFRFLCRTEELLTPRRRAFDKAVAAGVEDAGFKLAPWPGEIPGITQFWKWTGILRLILAVEYHRFYDEAFTASLYLGRSFTFALYPPGYPQQDGWRRIGELVPELGSRDHWWHGFDLASAAELVGHIPAFEQRYLTQPALIERVMAVEELARRNHLNHLIAQHVARSDLERGPELNDPRMKLPSRVPLEWFGAAEIVIAGHGTENEQSNLRTWIARYGVDAWQCAQDPDP